MGKCINHPDIETGIICLKDHTHFCEDCAYCRTPSKYCKFRETCIIWFETGGKKKDPAGQTP